MLAHLVAAPLPAARPRHPAPARTHAYQVQARHPGVLTTRFPTAPAALRRNGWTVKIVAGPRGSAATKARMPNWRRAGGFANTALARNAAARPQAHGMQARVAPVQ